MIERRVFLGGLLAALAAPAIVRAPSLMPVRSIERFVSPDYLVALLNKRIDEAHAAMRTWADDNIYKRYTGYEALGFDSDLFKWKSAEEVQAANDRECRRQLVELQNNYPLHARATTIHYAEPFKLVPASFDEIAKRAAGRPQGRFAFTGWPLDNG